MIRNLVARFTMTFLAVLACSPSSPPAGSANSDTAKTLAEAKARAQDLANSTRNYQPVRFVSDIEQVRAPRPVKNPMPADVVKEGNDRVSVDPIPMPAPLQEDSTPSIQTDASTETAVSSRVPSIIPREAPLPAAVGGGSGEWRGNDPGPDMGTTIGVVLRGGRVDPGHCPRHPGPRPPSQIPNKVPRR